MKRKKMAVLWDAEGVRGRELLRGLRQWWNAGGRERWHFLSPNLTPVLSLRQLVEGGKRPDGVLGDFHTRDAEAAVRALGCPVVNTSNRNLGLNLCRVCSDDQEIGRRVAEDLLGRGFRAFAFLGIPGHGYAELRQAGFRQRLADAGFPLHDLTPTRVDWEAGKAAEDALRKVLPGLPRPLAVMAANDRQGSLFYALGVEAGIQMGEEMAVVGVDNDEVACELRDVPLSSVPPDWRTVGHRAAEMLDRLVRGRSAGLGRVECVPPLALVTRASSDMLMVGDAGVEKALRWMRSRPGDCPSVAELAKVAGMSRRVLERRFRELLNQTPLEAVHQARLAQAKRLLSAGDDPVSEVAEACGYSDQTSFGVFFRRQTGLTPTAWRRRFRPAPPA